MIRKLLIVFASGLVLAVVSLSSAWVIGGQALLTRLEQDGHVFGDSDEPSGPVTTRTLPFDGKQLLTIDAPVSVEFVRGETSELTISGPSELVDRLRWENGTLSVDGKPRWGRRSLEVTITAPIVSGLVVASAGDVELHGLDQPALRLSVSGAGSIEGSGRVDTLDVSAQGAGDIDLAAVEARDAKVRISGIGDIDVNARGTVDADISGAGSITLHTKPAVLTSRVSGAGSIDHDYPRH